MTCKPLRWTGRLYGSDLSTITTSAVSVRCQTWQQQQQQQQQAKHGDRNRVIFKKGFSRVILRDTVTRTSMQSSWGLKVVMPPHLKFILS